MFYQRQFNINMGDLGAHIQYLTRICSLLKKRQVFLLPYIETKVLVDEEVIKERILSPFKRERYTIELEFVGGNSNFAISKGLL